MKNIWLIPISVFALSLASCNETDVFDDLQDSQGQGTENVEGKVKVRFEANAPSWDGNESRTELVDGTKVYWNNDDKVSIFSGVDYRYSDWNHFRAIVEGDRAKSAVLEGYASQDHNCFFAFYPSSSVRHVLDMIMVYVNIPTTQQAVPGTFANNLNPAWAFTEELGGSMNFNNIAALIKFSIKGCDDICKVTLTTKKDMQITGDYYIDLKLSNADGISMEVSTDHDAYSSESVILEGDFNTGVPYYFVMSPMNRPLEEGFTVTFEKKDGSKYVKTANAGVINELFSGRIANIGEIDLSDAVFSNDIMDMSFISAVEEATGIQWSKKEDGSVPLTDENLNLIKGINQLDISKKGLTDLSYLKHFTGLRVLNCSYNEPLELPLSELTELTELNVSNCKLKNLDLSSLTKLNVLDCSDNKLESLDLSNNSELTSLTCYNNFWIGNSLKMNHLSNLVYLKCGSTGLTTLDLNGLEKLQYLDCQNNHITELNVKNLTELSALVCNGTSLTSLDVSGLTKLTELRCGYNENLSDLNMTGVSDLRRLQISYTNLGNIDISRFTGLEALYCSNTKIVSLDLSEFTNLTYLECFNNSMFDGVLDLSNCSNLWLLSCNNSNISSLDLSNCVSLNRLYCSNNKLSVLNLENNVDLRFLSCNDQELENGAKLQLYLNIAQKNVWDNISSDHAASVDVYFDNSVVSGNHGGFNESDYSGVLN